MLRVGKLNLSWNFKKDRIKNYKYSDISDSAPPPLKNVCNDLYIYLYNIPPFPIKQSRDFNHSRTAIEKQVQRGKPREENRFHTHFGPGIGVGNRFHTHFGPDIGGVKPVSHPFWTKNRGCETGFLSEIYLFVSL